MTVSIGHVRNEMNQILALRDKFFQVSQISDEKLFAMIETAKTFHSRLEPLNKGVEKLNTRMRNLEYCINGLSHVQGFYKTGRDVERVIGEGPTASLENYIAAMDRIRESLSYFDQNNNEHVEYSRLSALFSNGLNALEKQFDEILHQSFSTVPPETLFKLAEPEDVPSSTDEETTKQIKLDTTVSEEAISKMKQISTWLRKIDNLREAKRGKRAAPPGGEAYRLPDCLNRYCEYRRDLMRLSISRLREYQRNLDKSAQIGRSRVGAASSSMNLVPSTRKRALNKAVGLVWDATSRRGGDQRIETEDLDSEQYCTSLSAFIILVENDRTLLDRLQLTINSHETHLAHHVIAKAAANELLSEGSSYVRLMARATTRGEFHMILSLLTILKCFTYHAKELSEELKVIEPLAQPMTDLVNRLRAQSRSTLDCFIQQLSPHAGSSLVPPDATVHELVSNALLYLEKLMDYESIVGTILTWDEKKYSPDRAIDYLTTVGQRTKASRTAFGEYILQVIAAVIKNIEKKSESYSDDILKLVFQMNNLCYILKTLKTTGLQEILTEFDNSAVEKFTKLLNECQLVYTKGCMRIINLPSEMFIQQLRQRRQMDSKERGQMKDIWTNINQGLNNLMKLHSQLSIPDKELRESLRTAVCRDLVPVYSSFRETSLNTSFTSRREKYIRMDADEFQTRLGQLFFSGMVQN